MSVFGVLSEYCRVDATQTVGAMPIDVSQLRPDFLASPTYK